MLLFENYDLSSVVTTVDAAVLERLLLETEYNSKKRKFVVEGLRNGFPLGYEGPKRVHLTAPNLKLRVGDEVDLWNKIMKEVMLKRVAGPYKVIPFQYYIQSPIGLVPKDGGVNTRLIFHLSYPKTKFSTSVNANMPEHLCRVKYPDFCEAIKLCMDVGQERTVFISRTDISAAFRNLGLSTSAWRYVIMKAKLPLMGGWNYFAEKCLSFGAAISCRNFQEVSNCVAHIVKTKTHQNLINYLDDYFFCGLFKKFCNGNMREFIWICEQINLPISPEKTLWATTLLTFLGFLIDTINSRVLIPCEKISQGFNMINNILNICDTKPSSR